MKCDNFNFSFIESIIQTNKNKYFNVCMIQNNKIYQSEYILYDEIDNIDDQLYFDFIKKGINNDFLILP